jgi:kynureninase
MYDMQRVTSLAHECGALVLWDLSHAVGAVPIELNKCNVDLAIGCTYKYLNGGPGAPAFLYVRKDLQPSLQSPIWGWFSQTNPFAFDLTYSAVSKVRKFLVGTPPAISLALIEPGVDMVIEAGIERLREKSIAQTEFLIELWKEHLEPCGVALKSPRNPETRGSHVSFGHPEGLRIDKALIDVMKVIPDFRSPDNIRFGVTPLYTTFEELEEAVMRFKRVMKEGIYENYSAEAPVVT